MMIEVYKGLDVDTILDRLPDDQLRHIHQVRKLVDAMSTFLYASGEYVHSASGIEFKQFGAAAFYHDIGKVCIPPELLSKPDKLTAEEYRMVQMHPVFGKELFAYIRTGEIPGISVELIPLAHDAAVYHHEWWDRTGYPYGIGGERIPFIARVTAVCDAYDAMTSNRAYRAAHSHTSACDELYKGSGTQFEPGLVNLFLQHEQAFSGLTLAKITAGE